MKDLWQSRISRIDRLIQQSHGAREMLSFYKNLLEAQRNIHQSLAFNKEWLPSGALEIDLEMLRPLLAGFLKTVADYGPEALSLGAKALVETTASERDELLLEYWYSPSDVQFFAKAILQPYMAWLIESGIRPSSRVATGEENRCPYCGGRPQLAFITTSDQEEGGRSLQCSNCLSAWPFRRVVCANCLEENPDKVCYYHTPEYDHVRVEACDACKCYLKGVDLTNYGLAVPLVDEVAAAPLDVWAREKGYSKIELNLVGL